MDGGGQARHGRSFLLVGAEQANARLLAQGVGTWTETGPKQAWPMPPGALRPLGTERRSPAAACVHACMHACTHCWSCSACALRRRSLPKVRPIGLRAGHMIGHYSWKKKMMMWLMWHALKAAAALCVMLTYMRVVPFFLGSSSHGLSTLV